MSDVPTILVVDDEPRTLVAVSGLLREEGYETESARDGHQALAKIEAKPSAFSLVVLDVTMPGISGFEVAQRLKGAAATKDIPIILLTTLTDKESRLRGLGIGVEGYLTKPIDKVELRIWVRHLLHTQALYGQIRAQSLELEGAESRVQRLLMASPVVLYTDQIKPSATVEDWFPQVVGGDDTKLLGIALDELGGEGYWSEIHEEDRPLVSEAREQAIKAGHGLCEYRFRHAKGHTIWLRDEWRVLSETDGQREVIGSLLNISKRKRAEEAFWTSNQRYQLIVNGANDGIWDWDLEGDVLFLSSRWYQQLGLSLKSLVGAPDVWLSRVLKEDRARLEGAIRRYLQGKEEVFSCDYRIRHESGHYLWMEARGLATFNSEGKALRFSGSQTDITHHKQRDPLTRLANRELFSDLVSRALVRVKRRDDSHFALILLDVDRFEQINAELGVELGDQLLVLIARRLEEILRQGDVACRLSADEFAVILDDLAQPTDAAPIAKRILATMADPFLLKGVQLAIQISLGVHTSPHDCEDAKQVLRETKQAMKRAKEQRGSQMVFFEPSFRLKGESRLRLGTELGPAIESGQMRAYYHPLVCLRTGELAGFEALVRWEHPELGLLSPVRFVPIAEDTGLIVELGRWMRNEVCRQLQEWRPLLAEQERSAPLFVSVNVASPEFVQRTFLSEIEALLEEYQLETGQLRLEITERILLRASEQISATFAKLKELAIPLYLDDFGTGFSALGYLLSFPLHSVKIDRGFIQELHTNTRSETLVRAIISMAHHLELQVTAEGIEEFEHQSALCEMGCEFGQGFLYTKPLPKERATELLRDEWIAPGIDPRRQSIGATQSFDAAPAAEAPTPATPTQEHKR